MARLDWKSTAECVLVAVLAVGCVNHPSSERAGGVCRPQQLNAEVSGPGGTGGSAEYRITIHNQGEVCSLPGTPTMLDGVELSGRVVRVSTTPLSPDWIAATTTGKAANLTRAASADVVLLTGIACPAAQGAAPSRTFQSLRLGMETGVLDVAFGQGPEPADSTVSLPCDVAMSRFYASQTN
ncbi:MAG TPA: hypothetical protein VGL75_16265 [Acidothermaceae bacterium]|jgi:hypothetical protein